MKRPRSVRARPARGTAAAPPVPQTRVGQSSVESTSVTGPSFSMVTRMTAPKLPVRVSIPRSLNRSTKARYSASARLGSPALSRLGRRPRLMSANSVNCDTISAEPFTSSRLTFILPASSPNTRMSINLSASLRTFDSSSSAPAPTNNTRPGPMVATCWAPDSSQVTEPEAARCATTRTYSIDLRAEVGFRMYERVDVAEPLVAVLEQLVRRLRQQRLQVPKQRFVEHVGGGVVVHVSASLRLRHDLLDDAHRQQVPRRELQLFRRFDLTRVVAPHDRRRGFRRRHRVDRVLEHDHAVRNTHAQRAAAAAFTDHRSNYRHRDAEPFHDRSRDGGRNAPLLRAGTRVGARRVYQRDDREAELGGVVREAQRLAVTLGMHHAPVPRHPLLEASTPLVA